MSANLLANPKAIMKMLKKNKNKGNRNRDREEQRICVRLTGFPKKW